MRLPLALIAATLVAPAAATAQALRDCDTWEANARHVVAPPHGVQDFAEGAIRVIGLDTAEPACCSAHLMVIHPVPDAPFPACTLVSHTEGQGFSGLDMAGLTAAYDPATGLVLTLPVGVWEEITSRPATLTVTVNQASGQVTAR
jgi:hypothetical protein